MTAAPSSLKAVDCSTRGSPTATSTKLASLVSQAVTPHEAIRAAAVAAPHAAPYLEFLEFSVNWEHRFL